MKTDEETFICQFCGLEKSSDAYCGAPADSQGTRHACCNDCAPRVVVNLQHACLKLLRNIDNP